jgi:hypothetical protein
MKVYSSWRDPCIHSTKVAERARYKEVMKDIARYIYPLLLFLNEEIPTSVLFLLRA